MKSMTGFGTGSCSAGSFTVRVRASSLNSKYLEIRVYLPEELLHLEPKVREAVRKVVRRGSVRVRVDVEVQGEPDPKAVKELLTKAAEGLPPGVHPVVDLLELLRFRPEIGDECPEDAVLKAVDEALGELNASRREEGKKTAAAMRAHLGEMAEIVEKIDMLKGIEAKRRKERVRKAVDELAIEDESVRARVMAELNYYITRLDVSEELERLRSHLDAFSKALGDERPVGRRLEFLCQEINREANTLSQKSVDPEVINLAIRLKELAEELREQARNVE